MFDPIKAIVNCFSFDSILKLTIWCLILISLLILGFIISPILVVNAYPLLFALIWGVIEYFKIKSTPRLEVFLGILYLWLIGIPAIYLFANSQLIMGAILAIAAVLVVLLTIISYRQAKHGQEKGTETKA